MNINQPNESIQLEIRLEEESVWLSIDEMSKLFNKDKSVIGKHIRNIFKEEELCKESVWAKYAYTASDNKIYQVDYYNLDVIISVGLQSKHIRNIYLSEEPECEATVSKMEIVRQEGSRKAWIYHIKSVFL